MSDLIIKDCMDDIQSLIDSVLEFDSLPRTIYQHEDLLTNAKKAERRHGKPVIGLVYMGLSGLQDITNSGVKAIITVDVYLLGVEGVTALKGKESKDVTGLTLLDHVRKGIKAKRSPGQTVWKFVHELPTAIGIGDLEFVQRWTSVVPI